jgi:hypothetical protein
MSTLASESSSYESITRLKRRAAEAEAVIGIFLGFACAARFRANKPIGAGQVFRNSYFRPIGLSPREPQR